MFLPFLLLHLSHNSPIGEAGVIGYIIATSLKSNAGRAAASLPSTHFKIFYELFIVVYTVSLAKNLGN